jgi:CheY-like chemotaxis protein
MPRILVIDDDTAVRNAIKLVLEQDGYDVVPAHSGRAGIAALQSGRFDLVICDIFMPDMDGIETIHAFHQVSPRLPVIAMSGFMFRDGHEHAPDFLNLSTKLGAACSLRKPFRPRELLGAVAQCLADANPRSGFAATG